MATLKLDLLPDQTPTVWPAYWVTGVEIVASEIMPSAHAVGLPAEVQTLMTYNAGTTTEFKFLTVGSVLWACRDEIVYLRRRVKELENGKGSKAQSKVR